MPKRGALRPTLVIMVKEPRPGRVKTRLGRDIGTVPAAWWFRHQTQRLIRRLTGDGRWDVMLAVSPDVEGLGSRVWPVGVARLAQGVGDLGDRMSRIFRKMPNGPVVIIGADIPGVTRAHIARAFAALGSRDVVFGPAPDGGYWLVGMKRVAAVQSELFDGVRWSTEFALADSLATLGGASVAIIDTLRDVDTVVDL